MGKAPPPKELDKAMDEPFRTSIVSALITTLEPFPGPNRLATMPALPDMEKEPASMLIPGASPATGVALNDAPLNVVIPGRAGGTRRLGPGDIDGTADLNIYLATSGSNCTGQAC